MKKLFALILVVAMCFVLGSCSFVESLISPDNENGDNTNSTEIRTTVTEEEWDAAMSGKNFTAEVSLSTVHSQGDIFSKNAQYINIKQTETSSLQNNKFVVESNFAGPETTEEGPEYIVKQGDDFYSVTKEDEAWVGNKISNPENVIVSLSYLLENLSEDASFKFEDFTYNEETKAYECEAPISMFGQADEDSAFLVVVYFENGKIVKAEISESAKKTADDISYSVDVRYVFTDFGTTVVNDIPEFTVE